MPCGPSSSTAVSVRRWWYSDQKIFSIDDSGPGASPPARFGEGAQPVGAHHLVLDDQSAELLAHVWALEVPALGAAPLGEALRAALVLGRDTRAPPAPRS